MKTETAFLFSGQGSQYPGMAQDFYESIPASRQVFNLANDVLGRDISKMCFEGSQDDLNQTHNTQPCLLTVELAMLAALRSFGFEPDSVAGFSLGEYTALVAAHVITIEDAFRIIQIRADAMQDAVPIGMGAMVAVMNVTKSDILSLCEKIDGYLIPANYNCPGQIVISGEAKAIDSFLMAAKEKRIRAIKLPVSAPFHCKLMQPAAEKLNEIFKSIDFHSPHIPLYFNIDAKTDFDPSSIKNKMVLQAVSPVVWQEIILSMYKDGYRHFVEIGPGDTLSRFCNKTLSGYADIKIDTIDTLEALYKLEQ